MDVGLEGREQNSLSVKTRLNGLDRNRQEPAGFCRFLSNPFPHLRTRVKRILFSSFQSNIYPCNLCHPWFLFYS